MDAKRIKPGDYWIDDEGARWMATEDHPDSEGYYPVISIDGMIPDGIVLDAIPSNRINLLAAAQRLGGPLTPWVRRCAELEEVVAVTERDRDRYRDGFKVLEQKVAELKAPTRARKQPCGCVVCYCEGERCQGCGAKNCLTPDCVFRLGNESKIVYARHALVDRCAELEKLLRSARECLDVTSYLAPNTTLAALCEDINAALGKEASTP